MRSLEHRHRGVAERRHRLDHGGEAGLQVPTEPDAVEPGDRHVAGDAQARVLQRRHGPDRGLVVGADHGARHPPGGDDPLGDPPAARGGEVAVVDGQPARWPASRVVARRNPSSRRAESGESGGPRDEADVAVAVHVRQVHGHLVRPGSRWPRPGSRWPGRPCPYRPRRALLGGQQHDRDARRDVLDHRQRRGAGQHDEPVAPARDAQHQAAVVAVVAGRDEHRVSAAPGGPLHAPDHLVVPVRRVALVPGVEVRSGKHSPSTPVRRAARSLAAPLGT